MESDILLHSIRLVRSLILSIISLLHISYVVSSNPCSDSLVSHTLI